MLVAACGGPGVNSGAEPTTAPPAPPTTQPSGVAVDWPFLACDDISDVIAPDELFGDSPVYVGNEMPTEEVQAWAQGQPGYQTLWIDRDHNGWIVVGFSQDVADRQADLAAEFPLVGVVAVEIPHDLEALRALQDEVAQGLREAFNSYGVGVYESKGVVAIDISVPDDAQRAFLVDKYAGQPICINMPDPSTVVAPGPQPDGGDGWRLLASEKVGFPYRTGIATDGSSVADLWLEIGLNSTIPEIDFRQEVVIWFGAVYGSSCPNLRLDDVVVDGAMIYAEIVNPDNPIACTDDANPHAFVVAVDRAKLPSGPFAIQLDGDGPPRGAPEERTVVSVDLSIPGAVAEAGETGPDPGLPGPPPNPTFLEPGFPSQFRYDTHCGIDWFADLNGYTWRASQEMPLAWAELIDESEIIQLELLLETGDPPTLTATAGGASVLYEITDEEPPGCD